MGLKVLQMLFNNRRSFLCEIFQVSYLLQPVGFGADFVAEGIVGIPFGDMSIHFTIDLSDNGIDNAFHPIWCKCRIQKRCKAIFESRFKFLIFQ